MNNRWVNPAQVGTAKVVEARKMNAKCKRKSIKCKRFLTERAFRREAGG